MDVRIGLLASMVLLVVSGCATMSAEQCTMADWHTIGLDDGSRGLTLDKADRRDSDCAKHGYAMDRAAYGAGREEGLGSYCRESTGYQLGESGRAYNGVCAQHDEATFLAAYDLGREYRSFNTAVSSAAAALDTAKARHNELDTKLDKYSGGYRDEGLTMEEHNTMVLELWAERKYLAKTAIPYWSHAHGYQVKALDEYQQKVAANDPALGSLAPLGFPGPDPYDGPTKEDARAMLQEVFSSIGQASRER